VSALLLLGAVQTAMAHSGRSLIPPLLSLRRGIRPRGMRPRGARSWREQSSGERSSGERSRGARAAEASPTPRPAQPAQPPHWERP
jgi:hypothetical protein